VSGANLYDKQTALYGVRPEEALPCRTCRKPHRETGTYPTDLTDEQWELVESLVRASNLGLQDVLHPRREVANTVLYITHPGAQWSFMPHDLPN
jgi:hypothetical protein